MEKKVLLIVNPVAGLGNIKKDINKIINNFENLGYKTEIEYTTLEKNGESIVQEKVNDGEIVVAVGGDGTLNEVVNGVLKNGKKVKMGFIPLGTTNDFAKTLNIPTDKYLFSREINNTIEKTCDIGKFNEKYFNYVSAFGTFAKTSFSTQRKFKNRFGRLAYLGQRN